MRFLGLVVDGLLVLLFVGIGRRTHAEAESVLGFASAAWPFLAGLLVGWAASRGWRRPLALVPTGVVVWVSTVAVGMVLRAVSGQGTAVAFVLVATGFLGAVLLGWRALAVVLGRRVVAREG
ncbi:DUF3054 domain-containing protein [Spirillospora albida]|uniref:DUF3054 domain-containing protein n=1 Tax=Spirillospora albida TaxID=58123 RepID=UPI0004C17614|nr:DUF3054 domain-containing protein [Spirillospora albida]